MHRRLVPVIMLLIIAAAAHAQQDPMMKFTKNYYRSNPFTMSFSSFLQHVMLDPTLTSKTTHLRTDTSLFAFNGTYKTFNPFGFKPARVDVALIEQNVQLYEGRPQGDTIMLYVIIAYGDSTADGLADVKKEYDRVTRKAGRMFFDTQHQALEEQGLDGEISNFFVSYAQLSPVTVEWLSGLVTSPLLRLTMRIRSRGNETVLPMSLYDSQ